MENDTDNKTDTKLINGVTNIVLNPAIQWEKDITVLDLKNQGISACDLENTSLPENLITVVLSHNNLERVPRVLTSLKNLRQLDLCHNNIEYFDEIPLFCHNIEKLNLSYNSLRSPPIWIWIEQPKKLTHLNLSHNCKITGCLNNNNYEEILACTTMVTHLDIHSCRITQHLNLIATFPKAKELIIGSESSTSLTTNFIEDVPSQGLKECCDIEKLDLTNTRIYTVNQSIDIYKNLIEINLSQNNISNLPKEFCNLTKLKKCVLSYNSIIYLPDEFTNLINLTELYLNNNVLCMLQDLAPMKNLKVLDLYSNNLYDVPEDLEKIAFMDLAQNYLEEPTTEEYLHKKEALRSQLTNCVRIDGMQVEVEQPSSDFSTDTSDEEFYSTVNSNDGEERRSHLAPSSEEDWDSDSYWVPHQNVVRRATNSTCAWRSFVERKYNDGNLCPFDQHTVSIAEQVKYEQMCNPKVMHESDGQFSDYTEDDS